MATTYKKIGILGGGQLGQMLFQSAISLGFYPQIFGGDQYAPCHFLQQFTPGDLYDCDAVVDFGKALNLLTVEVEHVSVAALQRLQGMGVEIFPRPELLAQIANKSKQKQLYQQHNFPTAKFWLDSTTDDVVYPAVAKTCTGGYDGRGVKVVENAAMAQAAFGGQDFFVEEKISIVKELSILVARNRHGQVAQYTPVQMEFCSDKYILEYFFSPPEAIDAHIIQQAIDISYSLVEQLDYIGLMAVEFFVDTDGKLLINEIAPRVHNSGHHTQISGPCSQFDQHWRAILGLPLGATYAHSAAAGSNVLGNINAKKAQLCGVEAALSNKAVQLHLYNKFECKIGRKMGHVVALASNTKLAKQHVQHAKRQLIFTDAT